MRTTVIPAQITTVEDKIAGNLNFTQLIILMVNLFVAMVIYTFVPPTFGFTIPKVIFLIFISVPLFGLILRIKGKTVFDWLLILTKFNLRPKYYIYNKNDLFLRNYIDLATNETSNKVEPKIAKIKKQIEIKGLIKIEDLIENKDFSLILKAGKKGGLNVAFNQIQSANKLKKAD